MGHHSWLCMWDVVLNAELQICNTDPWAPQASCMLFQHEYVTAGTHSPRMPEKSTGSMSFPYMPDLLRESGAFSLAQQYFVSKSVAELWHGGAQMALAVQRRAGDDWKPGWIVLTCQSLPPFPLESPGQGRQSRGLLKSRVTQNTVTLLKELGWIGRASRVGLCCC